MPVELSISIEVISSSTSIVSISSIGISLVELVIVVSISVELVVSTRQFAIEPFAVFWQAIQRLRATSHMTPSPRQRARYHPPAADEA